MNPVTGVLCLALLVTSGEGQYSKVTTLEKEFWLWRMMDSPDYATYLGYTDYNDQLRSYNISSFDTRKADIEEFNNRLDAISTTAFTPSQQADYDILSDTFKTYLDGHKWALYSAINPMNFLEGIQLYSPLSMATTRTRGDFENYIVRLKRFPKLADEIKESFAEAVQLNRTLHQFSIEAVPGQISEILVNDTASSHVYWPFGTTLDAVATITEADKADIRVRGTTAVKGVNDSYANLQDYIQNEYMLHTRPEIGVNSLDNGTEYYRACLKWHLSYDMSPEEVHQLGLQEVERIYQNMIQILKREGFVGTVKEFYAFLNNDSRFVWDDADRIIKEYEDIIQNRIAPKLPQYFKDIPNIPIIVVKLSYDGIGGGYGSATEDRPGVFYLNLFRPRENPTYEFMSLALHEANPGHHLQHTYGLTSDLPDYRRQAEYSFIDPPFYFPVHSAYVEGWALYSEYLGEEMGLYKDDYELMGRYSAEMLRACRLVVDTGLHHYNWEKERAVEYMLNYTSYSPETVNIEVNRYITWPGQACAYKVGEIRIRELRQRAESELGSLFDIRDFHSVVLTSGGMPLRVLDTMVTDWIAETKAAAPPMATPVSAAPHTFQRGITSVSVLYVIMALCGNLI